jgi:hypothetical protein
MMVELSHASFAHMTVFRSQGHARARAFFASASFAVLGVVVRAPRAIAGVHVSGIASEDAPVREDIEYEQDEKRTRGAVVECVRREVVFWDGHGD